MVTIEVGFLADLSILGGSTICVPFIFLRAHFPFIYLGPETSGAVFGAPRSLSSRIEQSFFLFFGA